MNDGASGTEAEPDGRSEFERFEALVKKLVAVPKAEVDALRKREKRRRRVQSS
jgi:hypothetical protein